MDIIVAWEADRVRLNTSAGGLAPRTLPVDDLPAAVREHEQRAAAAGEPVRWVWADTAAAYPGLLRAGVRVGRCVDLRLTHALLRRSLFSAGSDLARAPESIWDAPGAVLDDEPTLLRQVGAVADASADELVAEYRRQQAAIAQSLEPGRLRLLTAAESVGALIAAELTHVGLPFDGDEHDRLLTGLVGARPAFGGRPPVLDDLAERVRTGLDSPGLNPDSQPALLRALTGAGLPVRSTQQWELERLDHPAVTALLEYKKLARLLAANGWHWRQTWVRDGRFRPQYLPAGVPTGRWAARGGGALQLPKQIRRAVIAEPGCTFVVADAAQLEPRVLAAMSGDRAMAAAGRRADLYAALVDQGVVATRQQAKVAMLGALYGATTGESGLLMPTLQRAYPQATGLVERAARDGEAGRAVHTWLGRTSPPTNQAWRAVQQAAVGGPGAGAAGESAERLARRAARDWGRFTRNFVVQGTAAEWALCWLAAVRRDLNALARSHGDRAELVYFLHDEIVVHTPADLAGDVVAIVTRGAVQAGRLLFGDCGVEFAVSVQVADNYADAG